MKAWPKMHEARSSSTTAGSEVEDEAIFDFRMGFARRRKSKRKSRISPTREPGIPGVDGSEVEDEDENENDDWISQLEAREF